MSATYVGKSGTSSEENEKMSGSTSFFSMFLRPQTKREERKSGGMWSLVALDVRVSERDKRELLKMTRNRLWPCTVRENENKVI